MPIQKNAARTFAFRMVDSAGADKSGTPTVKVSKDGGAGTTATNSPAAISSLSTGDWTITLTAAEMNADCVAIEATLSGAVTWFQPVYPEDAYTTARAGYLDTLNGLVNAIWANGTRTLTGFGTLVADVATAVWGATTRTLSAFGFTVNTNANATETAIKAKTDGLPNDPADASDIASAFAAVPAAVWGAGTRTLSGFAFAPNVGGYVSGQDPATLLLTAPANKLATDATGRVTVGTNGDKTGYSLTQAFPTNFSALSIDGTGKVTYANAATDLSGIPGAVWAFTGGGGRSLTEKTGFALTQAFPANFSALSIDVGGLVTATNGGSTVDLSGVPEAVWEYSERKLTDDTGLAASRFLTMVGLNGGAYRFTAPSLALAPTGSGGGGGATVVVAIQQFVPNGDVPGNGDLPSIRIATTYGPYDVPGLGSLAGRTALYVTAKDSKARADVEAVFQIEETEGLVRIVGRVPKPSETATLEVVDEAAGTVRLWISDDAAAALGRERVLHTDVKVIKDGNSHILREGSVQVVETVTKAI